MYLLTWLTADQSQHTAAISDGLFDLINILEAADRVLAFKVAGNGGQLEAGHFGWGGFTKWQAAFFKQTGGVAA